MKRNTVNYILTVVLLLTIIPLTILQSLGFWHVKDEEVTLSKIRIVTNSKYIQKDSKSWVDGQNYGIRSISKVLLIDEEGVEHSIPIKESALMDYDVLNLKVGTKGKIPKDGWSTLGSPLGITSRRIDVDKVSPLSFDSFITPGDGKERLPIEVILYTEDDGAISEHLIDYKSELIKFSDEMEGEGNEIK